jgi:hypothetical protein
MGCVPFFSYFITARNILLGSFGIKLNFGSIKDNKVERKNMKFSKKDEGSQTRG